MRGEGAVEGSHGKAGEHLALLLAVEEAVVVLHRDERRELVLDSVCCSGEVSSSKYCNIFRHTLHGMD